MLPKSLKYGNKTESSLARSYTSNIQTTSLTTFKKGSVATVMIPTGPSLALISSESVLKFDLKFVGPVTNPITKGRLDSGGAHAAIQRIRIFHGSNLIQDLDNYALLSKIYFDLQVSTDSSYGKYSILNGNRADLYVEMNDVADVGKGGKATCINSGQLVNINQKYTYCITLVSLLGSLNSSHYFPLFECTSAPLRLEIQWANSPQSIGCFPDTTSDFEVENVEYIASYIALSNEAMSIIKGSQSGPISYTVPGIANFNTTARLVGGSNTQVNFNINAKYASVKNIITSIRDTDKGVNRPYYFPLSSCMSGIQTYNFRVGSQSSIPAIAPASIPNYFFELLKAVGSISDLNHEPSIDIYSYAQPIPALNDADTVSEGNVNSGSFYIGLDLENYAESDKSTIYTGYNTKNDDIYLQMTFLPQNTIESCRFDAYVQYDSELTFMNGTCFVSF